MLRPANQVIMNTLLPSIAWLGAGCQSTSEASVALELGDLVHAALVASAEIGGGQESLHHLDGGFGSNDAAAEGEDVGIIVFTSEASGVDVVSKRCAD